MRFRVPAGRKGQRRNYSAITTRKYLQVVSDFARHFCKSPDRLGANELRTYQAYLLKERKLTPGTAVNCVAALRLFFVKTLKRHHFREFLPYPKDRRRLPTVLSHAGTNYLCHGTSLLCQNFQSGACLAHLTLSLPLTRRFRHQSKPSGIGKGLNGLDFGGFVVPLVDPIMYT